MKLLKALWLSTLICIGLSLVLILVIFMLAHPLFVIPLIFFGITTAIYVDSKEDIS